MSRFNATKISSRFFNSNNHTLPVTFYNKFSSSTLTTVTNNVSEGEFTSFDAFIPESRSVIYPPGNAYYWKGSVVNFAGGSQTQKDLELQKLAAWWPLQTVENNKLVLRWTSITTKDYKFDSTLTKTRVSTKNSAEISQWHYPKMIDPGFSYVVWGRDTSTLEQYLGADLNQPHSYSLPDNISIPWTKYGIVKDDPNGVMEFIFNDRQRGFDDWVKNGDNFQWMITVENSNYEPPSDYGFAISGYTQIYYNAPGITNSIFPTFIFANEPYYGFSQWVVAMSPFKRYATSKFLIGNPEQGYSVSQFMNSSRDGWDGYNIVLTNKVLGSGDDLPVNDDYFAIHGSPGSNAYLYAIKPEDDSEYCWDNSAGTGGTFDWLEDVLNFAGREIETKYAFKGFNGESISALHHLDTSSNTNFTGMFQGAQNFNQDIGFLDFTGANIMEDMFDGANKYMQDMSEWKVSVS